MTARPRAAWIVGATAAALLAAPFTVKADHWWGGGFHWPELPVFDLALGDNVSSAWASYVDEAAADWNDVPGAYGQMINVVIGPGSTNAKQCRPTAGKVEVCNGSYGTNGWLGLAQAWLANHDNHIHMTQAIVKLNDSYFTMPFYDTPAWRQMVACHEIGHTLGLGHRDEDFGNEPLGSCLDYSEDPTTSQLPDDHDYEQLEWIYTLFTEHATPSEGGGGGGKGGGNGRGKFQADPGDAAGWGQLMADNGREAFFEADLGSGRKVVTFVLWAR